MTAAATAATFVWLGMVLGISFLETPLKFRAPGVDLRTGLAIGRLLFRALNAALQSQDLGDGAVYRVIREVQRKFWDPPQMDHDVGHRAAMRVR